MDKFPRSILDFQPQRGGIRVFGPVQKCIYCGESQPELTTEHILPLALDGQLLLSGASCNACQRIIDRFENRLINGPFHALRLRMKSTRRKKKKKKGHQRRPEDAAPILVGKPPDLKTEVIPIEDHPALFGLPDLAPCGRLRVDGDRTADRLMWFAYDSSALARLHAKRGVSAISVPAPERTDLARLFAKVAHGYAVATLGPNLFRPSLLDLILGRSDNFEELIGGPRIAVPARASVRWEIYPGLRMSKGEPVIVVAFRLFGTLGTPAYEVVAGDFPGALVQSHPSGGAHIITYNDACFAVLDRPVPWSSA